MTALRIAGLREATAVTPDRVIVLTEREQIKLAEAMNYLARGDDREAARLRNRILYGDAYENPVDELARRTITKRRIETALRKLNGRIAELDGQVADELIDRGESKVGHAGTGATLRLDSKIWAKVVRAGEKPTDDEKDAAAHGLIAAGLAEFVKQGFNTNTVSAYFREQIKTYRAEQQALPEDQRVPRDVQSFLPAELEGLMVLDDTPTVLVTAPSG